MANEFIIKNGFHSKGNSNVTGSLNISGTISGDGSGITNVVALGTISSSAQIASDISGSFTIPSASLASRITAAEVVTANPLVSSSAQIASDISGSFSTITTLNRIGDGSIGSENTPVTKSYVVTVSSKTQNHPYSGSGSTNGYLINGIESPYLNVYVGKSYKFNQSDDTNENHPLRFYLDSAKTTAYTANVSTSGTPGDLGALTQISITDTTPSVLYYQCSSHALMGNALYIIGKSISTNTEITGAFTEASGGFSTRITTLESAPSGIFVPTGSSQNTTNSVEITGSLKVTNTISSSFIGNGSALTNIVASATPAGPNTSIQFNNSGTTSGSSQFTLNKTNGHVTAVAFSGSGAALTGVLAEIERFYLHRVETINNPTSSYIEYFSKPQNSTELENTASVSGGTYFLECSVLCRNTSLGGRVFINPKIDSTNVFSKPFAREPKSSEDIFYVSVSKRVTLSAGDRTIQLQLANSGSGNARIFEANIQLTKV
mgnify:CR=1 FL=1|tara:strand:- start:13033 stop:14505 length:1473 start_codon:yes stop_codon:yes gene_type:complete